LAIIVSPLGDKTKKLDIMIEVKCVLWMKWGVRRLFGLFSHNVMKTWKRHHYKNDQFEKIVVRRWSTQLTWFFTLGYN
jgi:hypothetical protein